MANIIFNERQLKLWASFMDGRRTAPVAVALKGKVLQVTVLRTGEVIEITGAKSVPKKN